MKPKRQNLGESEKAALVKKFTPLAIRLAMRMSERFSIPLQTVQTESLSLLGLCVAEWNEEGSHGFDPSKGCVPHTWIYQRVRFGLLDFCMRKQDRAMLVSQITVLPEGDSLDTPAPTKWVDDFMHQLGSDAQLLVHTILHAPRQMLEDFHSPRHREARQSIERYMHRRGWRSDQFTTAWQEVEACL